MDGDLYKEVYYSEYCPTCEFKDLQEGEDPCHECLNVPARPFSHKPEQYKPKD